MIIDKYLVKHFAPVFLVALSMFVLLIIIIDLFVNLVTYLNYGAPFSQIMMASYYYVPKGVSYSLPISLLFAVAYTLGEFYAKNELTSIIAAGIPFWRVGVSLMVIGVIMSFFSFFFEDRVVIPMLREKNIVTRNIKQLGNTDDSANVVIKTKDGRRIYAVDFYDYQSLTLNGVIIVELDDNRNFLLQMRSQVGAWNGTHWEFSNPVVYKWENDVIRVSKLESMDKYDDDPELFRRSAVDPADLPAKDARDLVEDLKKVGLPYLMALADYYHRYSFSATAFIVIILSLSMAGRFRKNILLMSLLTSLVVSVIYYIIDMLAMMMARLGYVSPIAGAWFPVIFFIFVGAVLIKNSKT
ncbi:MAG: LptF/LptG family permease [Spirochaetaceae bacterium]|jgi:lipopolysaccharide export system permease protein|nr:LptF/LptG family permease [Spirochaetaceae bacterium]